MLHYLSIISGMMTESIALRIVTHFQLNVRCVYLNICLQQSFFFYEKDEKDEKDEEDEEDEKDEEDEEDEEIEEDEEDFD